MFAFILVQNVYAKRGGNFDKTRGLANGGLGHMYQRKGLTGLPGGRLPWFIMDSMFGRITPDGPIYIHLVK